MPCDIMGTNALLGQALSALSLATIPRGFLVPKVARPLAPEANVIAW